MRTHTQRWSVVALVPSLALLAAGGCALLSKSAPIAPHYYSPERPGDLSRPRHAPRRPPAELRLGRVAGVAHLGEMFVFRDASSEIGHHRLRRWTEAPEQYLKRRLARVLFEERGLRQLLGGVGPTLDVQLTAFEELRAPRHVARVQVIARLHDERVVRWQATITVDLPVVAQRSDDTADPIVAAIGRALRAAVDQIADRVEAARAATPVTPSHHARESNARALD